MEILLGIMVGISLSAACGFRIFVPMLVMSLAARAGELRLAEGFEWLASTPALVAFSIATVVEIAAYFIPWLDHLLDTIAGPIAIVAGVIATASCIGEMSPFLRWSIAILMGGGAAGSVQLVTSAVRLASSATTGGIGNPVVSTAEAVTATAASLLAIFLPFLALLFLLGTILLAYRLLRRVVQQPPSSSSTQETLSPSASSHAS